MKQESTDNNFTSDEHLMVQNKDYKEHSFRRPSKKHSIPSRSPHIVVCSCNPPLSLPFYAGLPDCR